MKKEMTFEAAGTELDAILAELSDSETPLDRSLVLYARAAELIAFCNETLQKAQITIDEIDAKTPESRNKEGAFYGLQRAVPGIFEHGRDGAGAAGGPVL